MKKFYTILLTLLVSLCCLTACGGDNPLLVGGTSSGSSGQSQSSSTEQTFTITYVVTEGGTMEGEITQDVTLGTAYELNTLTREGYRGYWTYEGEEIANTGVWEIAADVTLTSAWEEVKKPIEEDWTEIL